MSDEKAALGLIAVGLIAMTLLGFAVGIGYLLGPGAGWIAFAMISALGLYGVLKVIKAKAKEEQATE